MDIKTREDIVYKIMSGVTYININDDYYVINTSTSKDKYLARKQAEKVAREYRFESWLTEQQCKKVLVSLNLCSENIDSNFSEIERSIEDLKVSLYNSQFSSKEDKDKIRKRLKMVQDKQMEMFSIRHKLDHLTLSGYAEMVKQQYLIYRTIRYQNGEPVWEHFDDMDPIIIEKILVELSNNKTSYSEFRELARTDPWRSYWNINKTNPFGVAPELLSEDQKTLILVSKMYDNVYQSTECPPEEIIEDDDMLDGWMILNRRKNNKEKQVKQIEDRVGSRHPNASDVFVVTKDKEHARKINNMNTSQGQFIKKQRDAVIKQRKTVNESELPDIKLNKQLKSQQQFVDKVKGRNNG